MAGSTGEGAGPPEVGPGSRPRRAHTALERLPLRLGSATLQRRLAGRRVLARSAAARIREPAGQPDHASGAGRPGPARPGRTRLGPELRPGRRLAGAHPAVVLAVAAGELAELLL